MDMDMDMEIEFPAPTASYARLPHFSQQIPSQLSSCESDTSLLSLSLRCSSHVARSDTHEFMIQNWMRFLSSVDIAVCALTSGLRMSLSWERCG